VSYFIFEYLEKNRFEFDGMTKEEFVSDYEVQNDLNNEFLEYSRFNETDIHFENYQDQINRILKASIAQQLYGSNTYEAILNEEDIMIKKVLEMETGSQ
jgi:carboxyl-terminal processing protease